MNFHRLSRRDLIQAVGLGVVAAPVLSACGDNAIRPDSRPGTDAAPVADAPSGSSWAAGGTVAMTDKATYPDPFTGALASCLLLESTTAGPCTTTDDMVREDVSEGWVGLPVRLAFKVVNARCEPLANVSVKIWHTNREGSYSGETPAPAACLQQPSYASADFFRGVGTTDANGVVYFDTCFPGQYPGRMVHIHFEVKSGATSYKISQVWFPEDVTAQIFASHPEYLEFGAPDTTLATDGVARSMAEPERHTMTVARMTDGAMLASIVLFAQ